MPPMRNVGSSPMASSTLASMDDVVVLPCVPATASVSRSRPRCASICARCQMASPRSLAAMSSGLLSRMAVDTTTTSGAASSRPGPPGRLAGSWPMRTSMPAAFSCLV